ncbi:hypothetical protein K431DRAFT_283738 [Polychaeton citri CBS 116435]|uniref:Uncharacterized protein n=1 Tax=Polychaeton citri CBS 116435 TaxID=1314669 RepID=A0A9P4QCU6_9PEZI|nr:hypothetical protein K431DRAFT_283738 [Polychaeton citri CBS 116435]
MMSLPLGLLSAASCSWFSKSLPTLSFPPPLTIQSCFSAFPSPLLSQSVRHCCEKTPGYLWLCLRTSAALTCILLQQTPLTNCPAALHPVID